MRFQKQLVATGRIDESRLLDRRFLKRGDPLGPVAPPTSNPLSALLEETL